MTRKRWIADLSAGAPGAPGIHRLVPAQAGAGSSGAFAGGAGPVGAWGMAPPAGCRRERCA